MSRVSVDYTHAAPFIRELLIHEAGAAVNAKTQRDRKAYTRGMYCFAQALQVINAASDQTPSEGLPDVESYPMDALFKVVDFFKGDALDNIMSPLGAQQIRDQIARYHEVQNRNRKDPV